MPVKKFAAEFLLSVTVGGVPERRCEPSFEIEPRYEGARTVICLVA